MSERVITLPTPDGAMWTFIATPDDRTPNAVVVILMDGRGVREGLRNHARRLARAGYYVLLPNLYYRSFPAGDAGEIIEEPDLEVMRAYAAPVTRQAVTREVLICLGHAEAATPEAARSVGLLGYCMGGRLAVTVSSALGDRVNAVSSLHPGSMATRQPDSPHLLLDGITAEVYFGIPEHDPYLSPGAVGRLRDALGKTDILYEIEVMPGVGHGFTTPGNPTYAEPEAEHVWSRTLALFDRRLR